MTTHYEPIVNIKNDDLTKDNLLILIDSIIKHNGLIGHNLDGYNELVESGINEIMTQLFDIDRTISNEREGDKIKSFRIHFKFHNVKIGKPMCATYIAGQYQPLFPHNARITGIPYSGAITLQATVLLAANYEDGRVEEKKVDIPTVQIGDFPIMVGSVKCNIYNVTKNALKALMEDPNDLGGYFIAKRGEYIVDLLENIRYNSIHTHIQMGYKEYVRSEFLSQPGSAFENSSMLTIRYNENGQITIEISSTTAEKVRLPFYVIYRLFGMVSDKEISNTIVFDIEDKSIITEKILEILENAFHLNIENNGLTYEIEREKIIQVIAEKVFRYLSTQSHNKTEADIQKINTDVLKNLDMVILPHIGKNENSRIKKLKFIGLMIHKMMLVHFGVLSPIDRDSYKNKRVHGSGVSLAKAFKTQVNNSIVTPILKELKNELKRTPWQNIVNSIIMEKFNSALNSADLNKAMEQAITSGNKTIIIKRKAATNRVSSQALERKNMLNTISSLRTVVTQNAGNSSKQTERADKMRRVHPTYTGYICIAQSADSGEKVGMRKQLAITTSVCIATDAIRLKTILKEEIIPIENINSKDVLHKKLARIFVNGDWIGCTTNAYELVNKYRNLRKGSDFINNKATIFWDTTVNEVEFWLDVGRLTRPLLIVDSNITEYDNALKNSFKNGKNEKIEFVQNIRLTTTHISQLHNNEIEFEDLVTQGIIEYISPEEQENCLIAESIDELFKNRNNVCMQYTHCDIEQAILGLAALLSPYGNHTQPARITHSTNHARQSGGWYALNFPYRTDKNRFFQYYNEIPLVKTIAHKLIPSNGSNVIIAYASYGGDNQEDSAIVNQASVDRGLFNGSFFRYEIVEQKKNESFGNPDINTTKNIKPNASYEKLENGFIKKGSIVRYGDVMIGIVTKIIKSSDNTNISNYQYIDKSIVYKLNEPAVVENVIRTRGVNGTEIGIVKLRYQRPLLIGDKLSSRCGNKSIVASMLQQSDMPFTDSGITPDLVINPHSFPTRMTIGQLIETTVGKICSRKGTLIDGTSFLPIDHFKIIEEMLELGYRYNGLERMYNGQTGEYMDSAIFIGPNYEQRIQKFVLDDEQVVAGSGHTDATTGQPLGGKHVQGGLRIGEMEVWVLASHGSMLNMYEKLSKDSDGRVVYICRSCGQFAVYNEYKNIYKCVVCQEFADIVAVDSSKTAILFAEELAASNISMRYGLRPREYEQYVSSSSKEQVIE
jgi:DNA-directed RNA polymerase II subunit RPB2